MDISAILIANMMGAGIVGIAALCCRTRFFSGRSEDTILAFMMLISVFSCLVNSLTALANGHQFILLRMLVMLGGTLLGIASICEVYLWNYFLELHLYKSRRNTMKHMRRLVVPVLVISVLYIINIFGRFMFTLDDSYRYVRLQMGSACDFIAGLLLIWSALVYFRYLKGSNRMVFFPVWTFLVPAFLGYICHICFNSVSLLWPLLAVGIAGISMGLQNEVSFTDSLTGLLNRSYLDYILNKNDSGFGGVMIDVNSFKAINDNYGHSEGDQALKTVASVLQAETRARKGIAVRYAGDEFILIMNTDSEVDLQELVRAIAISLDEINNSFFKPYRLTLSYGAGIYHPESETKDRFLKILDERMYEFKKQYYQTHDRRQRR